MEENDDSVLAARAAEIAALALGADVDAAADALGGWGSVGRGGELLFFVAGIAPAPEARAAVDLAASGGPAPRDDEEDEAPDENRGGDGAGAGGSDGPAPPGEEDGAPGAVAEGPGGDDAGAGAGASESDPPPRDKENEDPNARPEGDDPVAGASKNELASRDEGADAEKAVRPSRDEENEDPNARPGGDDPVAYAPKNEPASRDGGADTEKEVRARDATGGTAGAAAGGEGAKATASRTYPAEAAGAGPGPGARVAYFLGPPPSDGESLAEAEGDDAPPGDAGGADADAAPPVLEYGVFSGDAAAGAAAVLEEALLPLLLQSQRRRHHPGGRAGGGADGGGGGAAAPAPDAASARVRSSLLVGHARKLASRIGHAALQAAGGGGSRLVVPPDLRKARLDGPALEDESLVRRLEACGESWLDSASRLLASESAERPGGPAPLDEVEFWRRRHSALSEPGERIASAPVRRVLDALRWAGSPLSRRLDEAFGDVSLLAAEAADNARFLATLERHLRALRDGSLRSAFAALPALVDGMRMVWTVSRHYNRGERLVPLMERVAWQLVTRVREAVDVRTLLGGEDHDAAEAAVSESRQLLEAWRLAYLEVRARIERSGPGQRRWEFDRSRLFGDTDHAAAVCGDLAEALAVVDQFRRFPELAAVTGGEAGGAGGGGSGAGADGIAAMVESLPPHIEAVGFDPFDRSNDEAWAAAMEGFRSRATEIEAAAGSSIEQAFRRLRSAEGAFDLVENFRLPDERYADILEQYDRELGAIERSFKRGRADPPIGVGLPPSSGAIAWALDLYHRAKRPILRFRMRDGLLSDGFGRDVKDRYLKFARSIDEYKDGIFQEWEGQVHSTIAEGLRRPILVRVEDGCGNGSGGMSCAQSSHKASLPAKSNRGAKAGRAADRSVLGRKSVATRSVTAATGSAGEGGAKGLMHNAFGRVLPLASNFPGEVLELIAEARHLDRAGFSVPNAAITVALQEGTYNGYVMDLDEMIKAYNDILSSLSLVEARMLKQHIQRMDHILLPGLTTLNWTSQRIPAFVSTGRHAIDKFRSVLTEVRKHFTSIEEVVGRIEGVKLAVKESLCEGGIPMTISDFADALESAAGSRLDRLVEDYRSIRPIMVKVEMVVTETDGGMSPLLSEYYSYWEGRIYNAIVRMVVQSLLSLLRIVQSAPGVTPPCRIGCALSGKELIPSPPVADVYKQVNRCVRTVTESSRRFVRWMAGTCIEAPPQPCRGGDGSGGGGAEEGRSVTYTFHHDVSRNDAVVGALLCLNREARGAVQGVEEHLEGWAQSGADRNLWDPKRKAQMEKFLDSDPPSSFFEATLLRYEDLERSYLASVEAEDATIGLAAVKNVNFFQIDCTEVALGMASQAREWKTDVGLVFHSTAKRRFEAFNAKVFKLGKDLVCDPESLSELKMVLGCVAEIESLRMDMELVCQDLGERYGALKRHGVIVPPEEMTAALAAGTQWHNLVVNAKTKDLQLADVKDEFREVTQKQVADFEIKIKDEKVRFLSGPGSIKTGLDDGLALMGEWEVRLADVGTERKRLAEQEDMFGLPVSAFQDLVDVERQMVELRGIYDIYKSFKEFELSQASTLWEDVDPASMTDSIVALEVRCRKFRVGENVSTFQLVQEAIYGLKEAVPLIKLLKKNSLQPRHWDSLGKVTDTQMKGYDLTLGDIFAMNLSKYPDEVSEVINSAAQENKIEVAVGEIETFWDKAELETQEYARSGNGKTYILRSADELVLQLEDHMLNLQTMVASQFVGIFKEQVKTWQVNLSTISDCLNVWFLLQRKWLYLESIYGMEDIRMQLPEEAEAFDASSRAFQAIMRSTRDHPKIVEACCADNRLDTLEDISRALDLCQKRLSDYLNTKRNAFARFYFISDDELISVLGSSDIQPHLLKLFDNVKRLGFGRGNKRIVSLESSEAESFDLTGAVTVDGPIECWMTKVDEEMKKSLHTITKEAIFRYAGESRTDWIADSRSLGMNTICGSQIWWTWEVEDSFRRVAAGEKQALRNLETKLTGQLADMVRMVRSPLDRIVRKKVTTLLVIDVHARDIVSSFVRESILSAKQFEWESQLRFYWDKDEDDCVVRQCTGTFYYGFEYMGLNGRLVITPLTDRCYMTLTQALTFKLGGSPAGPAGTGKTETVKDLAKSLALPCFVINCGEGLDYKAMGAIFAGLVQCGAWGCFDEFNRINIEVLSVVSAQLKAIQNAVISGLSTVDIGTGGSEIHIKRVKGFATSGSFITMNPGYAGRTELPDNLKALFRPVTMIVPDLFKIAENMLFSEGFDDSKSLAKKMVVLYKLAKEQLSKQFHYDFGLRSMKTVLVMAGDLKRQFSNIPEDLVLMRILRDANLPKFVFEDVPLFLGLINDLFPGMDCPRVGYENLRKEIHNDLASKGFKSSSIEVTEWQTDKAVQLFETQNVRHTTMLVGPTGGGKSLILRTLANGRLKEDGMSIKSFVINPKAQPLDELYGTMDPNTRDWTDGILSKTFREVNQPLTVGREKEIRWVIFDGDVDALWVENMNSVMDDNRLLTLPNGERIRLQSHCALICEVFDLQYASPATISRCGMVWVDPKNLGYRPYFERWVKQRLGENFVIQSDNESLSALLTKLFDKYVPPSIDYVLKGLFCGEMGEKLVQVIPRGDIDLCKQLCYMLDSFLPWPETDEREIESLFIYCLFWSCGALLDAGSRAKFHEFLKGVSTEVLPDDGLYDHYYSLEEHKWQKWDTRVPAYEEPNPFFFHQVVVPTSVSVLYRDMLERLAPSHPCLFVGECCGKTLIIDNYTSSLPSDQFANLQINMSSRTSSRDVQQNIEANVEKRLGSVYGPAGGKRLFVFIDDLNMPKVDAYGTQQPIALLLTLLDHGFIYSHDKDIQQRSIKDLHFVAAMGPPSGSRNPTDPRFVARFNSFHLTDPSEEVLTSIYSNIIQARMAEFGDDIQGAASKVTGATMELYNFIVEQLPPTPSKFHYIFTLRDLSRVFEGLCSATPEKIRNPGDFVRLWRNESHRVFLDRLTSEEDVTLVEEKSCSIIRSTFGESSDHALHNPMVFGDFECAVARIAEGGDDPRLYGDLGDWSAVNKIFDQVIESYNALSNSRPLSLVLFEMALSHLVRIIRIIRNPRGHALLIGIGGSGKQSLTKLAAYTCGCGIFEITLCRGYSESHFFDDLRELYKKLLAGPVVFLFSDAHVVEEGFLEHVSNMLIVGIPPTLFDKDEKDSMCNQVRERASSAGADEWSFFVETCRNNLHVVLAMSPSGDTLRTRCRSFPALVSSCVIDVFYAWPRDALEKVSTALLKEETNIPNEMKVHVSKHMVWTHQTVTEKAEHFRTTLKRPYFVTPKSFIDFITVYREQLRLNMKKIDAGVKRLDGGLMKLDDAAKAVDRMQVELRDKKVLVDAKTDDVKKLIETIQKKTEGATKSNEEATEKQAAAEEQAKIIVSEKDKADTALMAALPAVEAAAEALNNIKKDDLGELKGFNNPPIHVKIVCQMCAMLRPTREKLDDSWGDSKKMLGKPNLLDLLKEYPKDDMTEAMYKRCQKILKENKKHDITVENMATKSKAGKGLLVWVFAIMRYYEVAKDVEPLRNKVKAMEKAQAKTEAELANLKEVLMKLNNEISELQAGYKQANEELSGLQTQAEDMGRRLAAASKLIEGLTGERQRWREDVGALSSGRTTLIGNCLLGCGFLSYTGAFTAEYRHDLLQNLLVSDLKERKVPLDENFKVERLFTTEAQVQSWNATGLPSDDHSVQNGILTTSGRRFPLCIDPQKQAVAWIKNMYADEQLTVKTLNDSDFIKHMELAVQFGNPFLFENVGEDIDPILNPILDKDVTIESGRKTISIGDKQIEWDDDFRLFFCTKLSNPSYSPEVMGKVTLINYSVTREGLSDQLLNVVVSHERPDLEKQFSDLVESMAANSKLLVSLEDSLLKELSSSSGNILDNEDLISTLENTKHKATEIRRKIIHAETTKKEIDAARSSYRPVAKRGSTLYFSSAGLSSINAMYELSLESFLVQFNNALDRAATGDSLNERLQILTDSCTSSIYDFTCVGLFERHKLIFAFNLACMILDESGDLDTLALNAFLKGDTSVGQATEQKPESLSWIGDNGWKDLLHLAQICDVFSKVKEEIAKDAAAFKAWYKLEAPESTGLPGDACIDLLPLQKLCVMRVLRPDRCFNAARNFVAMEMGDKYLQPPLINYKLIYKQSSPLNPTIFILSPGADPQADIQNLGSELGFTAPDKFRFVSLGQGQGPVALEMLEEGYTRGHWVLLQNCHLLISWLKELDKKLEQMNAPNEDFRLWLTTEPTDKFPLSILQRSFKVVTEPPDGMKLNIRGTMAKINQDILDECPHPRFKPLVFALSYLHAVVQERRKYGKIGWNVSYDFNESDFNISRKLMCLYLTKAWEDGEETLPWGSLKYLIGDAMYGGRVSDDMDRRVLTTYLNEFFGDFLFDENLPFHFSRDGFDYGIPHVWDGKVEGYREYVESLPLSSGPSVFGLHPNAEIGYYMQRTSSLWSALVSLQPRTSEAGGQTSREERVADIATSVLENVPIIKPDLGSFDVAIVRAQLLESNGGNQPTPCQVVLLQEMDRWNELCKRIHNSLILLKKACAGEMGMNDMLDEISDALFNGTLPQFWSKLAPPTEKRLGSWMMHFSRRYQQYFWWIEEGEPHVMWLSGLHIPQSYLTALVQTTCRRKKWPLDKSTMYTVVTRYLSPDEISIEQGNTLIDGTYVTGLFLEGAAWDMDSNQLRRQDPKVLVVELPLLQVVPVESSKLKLQNTFKTPVYATSARRNAAGAGLVFEADLATGVHESLWALNGVALVMNTAD